MVLDMLKSNLRDYLISLYFLNYLKVRGYFFLYTILCLMLGAVLINPALTKLSVIHALPKEKFKHFVAKHLS